jgi:large conductance mechanosensitive channel
MALGRVDFKDLVITLKEAQDKVPAVEMRVGQFLNIVLNFLIVAFCIFLIVKQMNRMRGPEPVK